MNLLAAKILIHLFKELNLDQISSESYLMGMVSTESSFLQWMMKTWRPFQKQETRTSCSTIRRASGKSPRSSSRFRSKLMTLLACGWWWALVDLKFRGRVSSQWERGRGRGRSTGRRRRRRLGCSRTIWGIQWRVGRYRVSGLLPWNLLITIRGFLVLLKAA